MFALVGLSLASCSNENDVIMSEESESFNAQFKTDGVTGSLQDLYDDMILSATYISADSAKVDFIGKMNFDYSISISTEDDMLLWINSNISKTDFVDYEDAVNKWNIVKNKFTESFEANYNTFDALSKASVKDILELTIPLPQPPTTTDDEECEEQFDGCVDVAKGNYLEAVADAKDEMITNPGNLNSSFLWAKTIFSFETGECASQYADCILQ